MNLPTIITEKMEIAERIIIEEEWNDIDVRRYNSTDAYIVNDRTDKITKITARDTEETLHKKIEESYK